MHPICARQGCNEQAIKRGERGPPRKYCSNNCRQRAYNLRRKSRQPEPEDTRDIIGEAVAVIDQAYADLPGPDKLLRNGYRLLTLARELRRYHEGTWD